MKTIATILITIFSLISISIAETRMWTSIKGDTIEAELVNIISKNVVLKKMNGKQIQVPVSQLCAADQKYLATMKPPKIEIEVDDDVDDKTIGSVSGYDYDHSSKRERLKCAVHVKKKSREDNSMPLIAHLFVFSKDLRREEYIIEGCEEWEFSFENQDSFSFSSDTISLEHSKNSYYGNSGRAYAGYVFWVESKDGKLVGINGSKGMFETNFVRIKTMTLNTKFDEDFITTFTPTKRKNRK